MKPAYCWTCQLNIEILSRVPPGQTLAIAALLPGCVTACDLLARAAGKGTGMDTRQVIDTSASSFKPARTAKPGSVPAPKASRIPPLQSMFNLGAARCAEGATELKAKIRALGGDPEKRGSTGGALHRVWINIKSTITGMDSHAVLAECERAEDAAKRAYEAALKKDVSPDVRTMVERQYQGVLENHDRVRELRNATA